jgi:hypothetical protein
MQTLAGKEIPVKSARYQELSERFPAMAVELKKKGVTLQWLWVLLFGGRGGSHRRSIGRCTRA